MLKAKILEQETEKDPVAPSKGKQACEDERWPASWQCQGKYSGNMAWRPKVDVVSGSSINLQRARLMTPEDLDNVFHQLQRLTNFRCFAGRGTCTSPKLD